MNVLPIVDRELRVAARRASTYRTRVWAALGAIVLAAWKCADLISQGASSSTQGRGLFYTLSTLAFVYCLCIGARVTSDCVSEEKREGTLGLLFLTDLTGWDVALGKLVASSLNSFYGLLAVLPLLAMPLLLGGVTLVQFGRMVTVLLSALFFSITAGILISSLSRNDRRAIFATLVTVLGSALLPFVLLFFVIAVLEWAQTPQQIAPLFTWLMASPVYPFVISLPWPGWFPAIPLPAWSFWGSIGVVHALSWAMLLITALLLPVVWKERAHVAKPARGLSWTERWRLCVYGNTAERKALRAQLLERNPFLWLVSRDRLKPGYAWLFLVSMIAVWLWGYYQHQDVMFDLYPFAPTLMLIHCFLKVWVISEVSHRLVEDQRNGALELLLSTPLTMDEIVQGQRMALLRQFAKPVLVLGAIELAVFQSTYSIWLLLLVFVMLAADLVALMWVSLHLSLTARSINQVLLKSILWVLVTPWIAYFLLLPSWSWFGRHFFWHHGPALRHRIVFWFLIGMLNNMLLIMCWARPRLLNSATRKSVQNVHGLDTVSLTAAKVHFSSATKLASTGR